MINKNDVVVVLGSTGQIGHELVIALKNSGYANVRTPYADFKYASQIINISKLKPKLIINCTAYTNVDSAESDHENAEKVNATGVGMLGLLSVYLKVPVIHYSTDYVFDGEKMTYDVTDKTNPLNVYGKTKLKGENLLQLATSGIAEYEPIILRTSWVYSNRRKNFFKTILEKSMEKDELKVVNDQFGRPTSAKEIAIQTVYMLGSGVYHPGIFHLTCVGIPCSWYEFATEIVKQGKSKGLPIKAKILPCSSAEYETPVTRPKYSTLSTNLLSEAYGNMIRAWDCCLDDYLI